MESIKLIEIEDEWEVLQSFMPHGWLEEAKKKGALVRSRKFAGGDVLLRILLIHLADGCSLRETTTRAREGGIADISDVALLKRLKASGEWLRWIAVNLMQNWIEKLPALIFGNTRAVRVIDGSNVQEPGSTGSSWRIHYSVGIPSLRCDEVYVTEPKRGESFCNFKVHEGDIFLGDRGYAHRRGIDHVIQGGGDVLVRINLTNVPLVDPVGGAFLLLDNLRTLEKTRLGDWDVCIPYEGRQIRGRVCALKKDRKSAEKARQNALKENSRKGQRVRPETLESAEYVFVFTTLDRSFSPVAVLEMYRGRWQIELVFKRLKSLINIGHLKKIDSDSAKAWIHGKLMVAFLIEAMIRAGENVFPWGYPVLEDSPPLPMPLEGNFVHASFA